MALINRITRLIKTDFHAVLDQIEEPEQVLKQAIRDMEDELAQSQQILVNSIQEQTALDRRLGEVESHVIKQNAELDLCFDSEEDELAKGLIRRKLETERGLQRLNTMKSALSQFIDELRRLCDEQEASLEGLRQKSQLFVKRQSVDTPDYNTFEDPSWSERNFGVSQEEVEIAFLKEKNSRRAS
jgi:phage shock protein A